MNIAIVGAGLIGTKRLLNLPSFVKPLYICDVDIRKAHVLANKCNAKAESDWKKIIKDPLIEAVIVSTPNKFLAPVAIYSINNGKHVFVEKPGGKNMNDIKKIIKAHTQNPVVVMIGYNHRYHPSIKFAKKIIDSDKYGPVLFIRGKYGHGGRVGYEKEWRFNPDIAGGGELLDQGSHLIDLSNYFIGKSDLSIGLVHNYFWKSLLEDSGFMLLKNAKGQISQLSATAVEWKNIFTLELMLKKAKIQINGFGRSYGVESLTLYIMKKEMGPPLIKEYTFPNEDRSWFEENIDFFNRIKNRDYSTDNLLSAEYVFRIIENVYKFSNLKSV